MKPIIEVNHLSKKYKYGESQSYYTLRDSLTNFTKHPFGIGEEHKDLGKDEFWALKNISFKVNQGEAVGIIGPNGAGKSTILKILSRITPPSTGEIILRGKVGSLLEVGTGFQQELTGRENIYLNGAILGMKRTEINRKFDEIVDFSGVEKFIDTPVKHYSSGMYMRLAFAVAANLDSDILIVDEVLAVGDSEFQKKCLGKMDDVAKKEGRTILFVSHNMSAVKNLCSRAILLENGVVKKIGSAEDVVRYYLADKTTKGIINNYWMFKNAPGKEKIRVKNAYVQYKGDLLTVSTPFDIVTEFWCLEDGFPVNVSMHLYDGNDMCVYNISTKSESLKKGLYRAVFNIPANLMNDGSYYVNNMFVSNTREYFYQEKANSFEIIDNRETHGWHGKWIGAVRPTFIKQDLKFVKTI